MKTIKALAIMAATFIMSACNSNQGQKSLVLYYSQTGTTQAVAEEIARLTGADIESIDVTEPYGGTYDETIQRCLKEREEGKLPTVKALNVNVEDYDVIYLGYPIWFGTFAPPVIALLKDVTFEGKKIVPFCTFGSGGLEATARELKEGLPKAEIAEGYGVRTARIAAMPGELDRFLKESGLIEGSVEPLPEYSEQQPVTEAEKLLFDMACGDYQFPLGTPVTCGMRQTASGTEYKFAVDNGTTIYVIAIQDDDVIKAEFTRVVR